MPKIVNKKVSNSTVKIGKEDVVFNKEGIGEVKSQETFELALKIPGYSEEKENKPADGTKKNENAKSAGKDKTTKKADDESQNK